MGGAVERGPDQLGHAGVEHDDPLRVGPLAYVQHACHEPARARNEEPSGLYGEARREPVGRQGGEEGRHLAAEVRRRRHGARVPDGEPAADVERVEARTAGRDEGEERQPAPHRVPPGVDGTELRPDVEVDAAGAERAVGGDPGDGRRQLGLRHPELGGPAAHGEAGLRLGRDVGVEAQEDVEGRPTASESGPPGTSGERRQLLRALDGDPAQRVAVLGRPDGAAQVGLRLADALQGHPVVGDAGPAGRRPFAVRDDVRG